MVAKSPIPRMGTKEIVEHHEFINRIKKTLYYGASKSSYQCDQISRPLADYAAEIFSETHKGTSLNRLDFATVSKLRITPCSLILSLVYLDRLNDLDPAYAHRITPSELFLVAMMVSTKFYCGYDEYIYLSEWAEYGNMTVDYLKELELDFLDAMNWNIFVSNHEFFEKLKSVEHILAKRQGLKRGWLTYTELVQLIPSFSIAKQLLHASAVLALSYAAGVMSIATGFFLASHVPGTSLSQRQPQSAAPTNESLVMPGAGTPLDKTDALDYLMDDVNESIDRYEESQPNCTVPSSKTGWIIPIEYLNELMQSKCNYGPDIGTSTGAMLTDYLDEDGGGKRRNLTDAFEMLQPKAKPNFMFSTTLWFKFI